MSDLPVLTLCVCTYKRPWYTVLTLSALLHKVQYQGPRRFHIADGGSPKEELDFYREVLKDTDYTIGVTPSLSTMMNDCARASDEVWFVTLDDFLPHEKVDITPDVRFLLNNPDVGMIRMGRLAFWEHGPDEKLVAEMRMQGGLHWWVFDKQKTNHPYVCAINTSLYHRRFWDAYGDIPDVPPDMPGDAELEGAARYNKVADGPTVAIPMRFGEDSAERYETIWQIPSWRTDEYASAGGGRRM